MSQFYDGTKLLSLNDINGNKPEIYICTTNRTAGKTVYFSRYCVNRWIKYGEKFCLIYRYNYELDDVSDKFFKDIQSLFFPTYTMTSKRRAKGIYHELFLNEKPCGYAITLNSSDALKKYSHLLSDVVRMLYDEFMSESNHYCDNEVQKFISVHTSIARGGGKQIRYVPVYMVANPVSIINPYYVEMEISNRLKKDTKFLKGNGYVLEQGFLESASKLQKESAFNQAFANNSYTAYSTENIYLDDNTAFIEKPTGKSRYLATIKYLNSEYAIREYCESGFIYCDDSPDTSFNYKIAISTNDHNVNYVMLKHNDVFISNMRWYFERGAFRFKDLRCKDAILKMISY